MERAETRKRLIDSTIHIIAKDGLDKTTTKAIGEEAEINQVYIYRNFRDKEDMLAASFALLDDELFTVAMQNFNIIYDENLKCEMRCRKFFFEIWRFVLGNKEKCLAFIRYYYSPYFMQYSAEEHEKRYKPLVETAKDVFLDEANVWMILNHIFDVLLNFAIKVFDGAVSDNEDTSEHVFRLIYASIKQYFKTKESQRCEKSI